MAINCHWVFSSLNTYVKFSSSKGDVDECKIEKLVMF